MQYSSAHVVLSLDWYQKAQHTLLDSYAVFGGRMDWTHK